MDEQLQQKIKEQISSGDIVLFMKGTKNQPMCGFSKVVVDILNNLGVEFSDINILEDEEIRQGLKEYSNWPTYPQLYVNSQLVGGCDIIIELFESGELKELLNS